MRTRPDAAGIACLVPVLLLTLTGCADQKEVAESCAAKIAHMNNPPQHASDPRPEACEDLNDEDYEVIVVHRSFNDGEVFDEEGNVDLGRVEDIDE